MESKRKELGILGAAMLAAGFVSSTALAQSATGQNPTTNIPLRNGDPSPAVKIFPVPRLALGPFKDADEQKKPQIDLLLPDKRYYEQRDRYSLDLGNGATANLKGPLRVRVRIPL